LVDNGTRLVDDCDLDGRCANIDAHVHALQALPVIPAAALRLVEMSQIVQIVSSQKTYRCSIR
jgi:hypothetical protein